MDAPEAVPDARLDAHADGSEREGASSMRAVDFDRLRITELAARSAGRYFRPGESKEDSPRGWRAGRVEPLGGRNRERGRERAGRRWRHPV